MRETPFEKDLRQLHGEEVVEMEAGRPTGRSYKFVKPDPMAGWPPLARYTILALWLLFALFSLVVAGFAIFFGVTLIGSGMGWWDH